MGKSKTFAYPYRWVVLAVFMFAMGAQQLLWITFAPITSVASAFYKVSNLSVGILSMVFMIVYIIVSIPASWLIDKYGFHKAVGLGVILTAVFGMTRGIFANSYNLVLISQVGIALGQPLIINAVAKIASKWFDLKERATATGLSWLAGYLGLIVGLVATPFLSAKFSIQGMLITYGVISIIMAVLFIIFSKENPYSIQTAEQQEEKALMFDGLKRLLKNRNFLLFNVVFFIGMGIFNGLSTWIEDIVKPRGFSSEQAGMIGGLMVLCGVLGAGVMPMLSDRYRNRTRFILIAIAGCVPGLIGITFATSYALMLVSACVLGFFMLSTAPIGFQYCAEICFPVPEGTSTGVLMLMGQLAGVIFIFGMDMLKSPKTGSMTFSIVGLIILMIINIFISGKLKESEIMKKSA